MIIKKLQARKTSQTLTRGLQTLELIGAVRSSCTIRDLAAELKLPKTVIHRLVSTLEVAGYVRKNSHKGGYRLGLKLWSLGCTAAGEIEVKEVARRHLEGLASKTKELVHIAVRDRDEVVYIEKIESSQRVRAYIPVGGRAPIHCAATGKAILARYSREEVKTIVSSFKRLTRNTVVGLDALEKQLQDIRDRGYSLSLGEVHDDVGGVASAILDSGGVAVAAIGVTSPISRLTPEIINQLGGFTAKTAQAISRELGYGVSIGAQK
jgi:DNA-binding IclR family transcriptional regulator